MEMMLMGASLKTVTCVGGMICSRHRRCKNDKKTCTKAIFIIAAGQRKPLCGFMFYNLLYNILKAREFSFKGEVVQDDFRLILNHLAIVKKRVSASLPSGHYNEGGKMWVDSEEANVQGVILDDFNRALAWTGMLARRIINSPDDEEDPRRTFDFDRCLLFLISI